MHAYSMRRTDQAVCMHTLCAGLIKQYESHALWKIDGFLAKYREAKSASGDGQSVSITSPYVAVSRLGYRLRMTAYLYGYQKGE